ncbi:MAG: DciA family protein [Pyramidobacter sp.]
MAQQRRTGGSTRAVGSIIACNLPPVFQIACRLADMERRWGDVVGPQLASRTKPVSIEHHVVVVACESPAAAQMIQMGAGSLLARVKRLFGIELPGIKAVVRSIDRSRPTPRRRRRELQVPQRSIDEAYARASQIIDDRETAMAMARMEAAAKARYGKGLKKNG